MGVYVGCNDSQGAPDTVVNSVIVTLNVGTGVGINNVLVTAPCFTARGDSDVAADSPDCIRL